ncbi:hypothetical protein KAFR_0B05870 [Kazachstania africana CBS 2517]|uniref:Pre-mRNA-splicing factor CWC15 n=1 Tax=Kazachstania africana (strain ATCC 22294 / BCRC 22015 / CBS 2517 / CECT 1963 / NBRC 1671 / NRRL Y-8276) TaxID=1071382 RepID=H2AR83_KAZAF|nr:hypothetical protein KAFR_0B05870 [Kazachstania africana CBS 2517]CCF56883.1 hypothetical protein KAFR_0B05870 [Kazachstania africana CBS 2517]
MTTSHRPQLEARSGAKSAGYTPTSIEHARLLPGHTTLKYRTSEKRNDGNKQHHVDVGTNENMRAEEITDLSAEEGEYNDAESSDQDSDDDQEALRRELDQIRKRKSKQSKVKATAEVSETLTSSVTSQRTGWRSKVLPTKKNVNKKVSNNNTKGKSYINDLSRSDYHKDFLNKFVK